MVLSLRAGESGAPSAGGVHHRGGAAAPRQRCGDGLPHHHDQRPGRAGLGGGGWVACKI